MVVSSSRLQAPAFFFIPWTELSLAPIALIARDNADNGNYVMPTVCVIFMNIWSALMLKLNMSEHA